MGLIDHEQPKAIEEPLGSFRSKWVSRVRGHDFNSRTGRLVAFLHKCFDRTRFDYRQISMDARAQMPETATKCDAHLVT